MLSGLPHRFGEFRTMGRDVLPQRRRNPNGRVVTLHVALQWKQHAAFDESWQNGSGEVGPHLILSQPSRLSANVDTLGAEGVQIVVAVIRGDVPYNRYAVRVGRSDDCVEGQSVQTIRLRPAVQKASDALRQIGVAAHFTGPGGGLTGVTVFVLGAVGVAARGEVAGVAGLTGAGCVAGSIITPVA